MNKTIIAVAIVLYCLAIGMFLTVLFGVRYGYFTLLEGSVLLLACSFAALTVGHVVRFIR